MNNKWLLELFSNFYRGTVCSCMFARQSLGRLYRILAYGAELYEEALDFEFLCELGTVSFSFLKSFFLVQMFSQQSL